MFPIRSLDVLLCSPKLDRELVKLLKATFPDLYQNSDKREDEEEEEEEEVQLVIAADDDVTDDIIDSSQYLSFSLSLAHLLSLVSLLSLQTTVGQVFLNSQML